ncbi:MAG TPA: hypothetical protein PL117_03305 [Accumulibacter sp.]|uniref:hypothetical protein n=1 Tax=Accumulibacter sp. TaxID=2053492 RepID=UPI002B756CBD|nr:hypothetical protein [Accumulibacter sp.]HRF71775.1 hypothetical protein [Accumulibacter sp.]
MKQLLVGMAAIAVVTVGMWATSSGPLPQRSMGMDELAAQAVLTGGAMTRQAVTESAVQVEASATAVRQLTLNAQSDGATQQALQMMADQATSTVDAAIAQTATEAVFGTPTAVSLTATAIALAEDDEQREAQQAVWGWGSVIVPMLSIIGVAIVIGLAIRKVGDATAKRISVEAEAAAEARRTEAEAKAELTLAQADETRTRTARQNTERIGRTLLRHTADGNPVVMVELLPEDAAAVAGSAPVIPTNRGDMDMYSPAQWQMMRFLEACIDKNGRKSNVFPPASVMEDECSIPRETRRKRLKALGKAVRTQSGRENGGTWVVGYDTLVDLLEAVKRGDIALPEEENDGDETG